MTNIAFNIHISSVLKIKYLLYLNILPCALMLGSLSSITLIPYFLDFDINQPIRLLENPILTFSGLLTLMLALMLVGYLLGWRLNYFISSVCFNWDKTQLKNVYLYSQVPSHWLKGHSSMEQAVSEKMKQWQKERQQGIVSYVLKIGVVSWGVFMLFVMSIMPILIGKKSFELSQFFTDMCLWAIGGALFGYFSWFLSEREYRKHNRNMNAA